MSASLVGSEMCIRDRRRVLAGARLRGSRSLPRAPVLPALATAGPVARPVSYTHLTLPTICSV
eukprot:178327-Alexandrium_andersonii.AAC.1